MQKICVIITIFYSALLCSTINIPVVEKELSNGLKLLMVPDTTVAVASCRLYYFTGSYYETGGTTGLSHMYEHMMFKGTQRIGTTNYAAETEYMEQIDAYIDSIQQLKHRGYEESSDTIEYYDQRIKGLQKRQREYIIKDEIWSLYSNAGATNLNAWTSSDLTAYIVTLPAHKYELFLNIESDRMQNLVLREFYSERDVVTEERRQVYENNTMRHYLLTLNALFYTASPYRNPTIGWYSDIRNYTTEKLRTHISRYYRPDNAMIVIAGNIDTSEVYEAAQKYFGDIEVPETEIPRVVTREPDPLGVKRFEVRDRVASRVDILFHTTEFPHRDIYKLDVVENILSGQSGRLYQRLVQEKGLCSEVGAQNRWANRDGRFHIWAQLLPHADHEEVEKIILDEIEILSAEEPAEHELTRTRNQLEKHFVFQLKDLERLSDNLAYFENFSSWQDLFQYTEEIHSVEETADVVREYLNPDFRTVGYLIDNKENRDD